MPSAEQSGKAPVAAVRADVVRNQKKLLAAAAEVFVTSGVDAPVRKVAARAGVGMGTLYRHFPTRADLVVAVFRHQVEELAEAGPRLLADTVSPLTALRQWIDLFADFPRHQARPSRRPPAGPQLRDPPHVLPGPAASGHRAAPCGGGRRG